LPLIIRDSLRDATREQPNRPLTPKLVSDILANAITSLDDTIARDVFDMLPGGMANLANISDAEIRRVINDQHAGGRNYDKARLCMYGTTALVSLVDPEQENLWVANVGDCQAGML
jgi:pyruvate dehydrogenase phosphatase